jgi:hypothetical protein
MIRIIMKDIVKILEKFDPLGLEEMDSVRLMNRIDTKYVFSIHKLPELLEKTTDKYHALNIDHKYNFLYKTTYFDTSDYLFYYQHIHGKLQRFKVRYRVYEDSGISFLEAKCKTNKNYTVKYRIRNDQKKDGFDSQAIRFLQDLIPMESLLLKPVLIDRFVRLTLVGLETLERITIDYNISFSNEEGKVVELPFLAIGELKRADFNNRSPFCQVLKELKIRPTGFSKYCIGNRLLYDLPKKNIIKPKILLINKIENEFNCYVA